MFLWRAAGKPEPETSVSKFSDVSSNHKYVKAILWASENKIANGFKDGTFLPDESCTRGQIVTFIWRYMGMPKPKATQSSFSDVKKTHVYFKQIMWASEKGVTKGYADGTFRPDAFCNRAQCATFIYRALQL